MGPFECCRLDYLDVVFRQLENFRRGGYDVESAFGFSELNSIDFTLIIQFF